MKSLSLIIIHDDGTILMLEENYPEIKIIKNEENIGYTRAMNIRLESCQWRLSGAIKSGCNS